MTRLHRDYEPLRLHRWPGLSLTGVRLRSRPHRQRSLVLRVMSSSEHAVATPPVRAMTLRSFGPPPTRLGGTSSSLPAFPIVRTGRLSHPALRGWAPPLGGPAFTHVTACSFAKPPARPSTPKKLFSVRFHRCSLPASIATGRNDPKPDRFRTCWTQHTFSRRTARRTLHASGYQVSHISEMAEFDRKIGDRKMRIPREWDFTHSITDFIFLSPIFLSSFLQ